VRLLFVVGDPYRTGSLRWVVIPSPVVALPPAA
jgi:hypothetical protein